MGVSDELPRVRKYMADLRRDFDGVWRYRITADDGQVIAIGNGDDLQSAINGAYDIIETNTRPEEASDGSH